MPRKPEPAKKDTAQRRRDFVAMQGANPQALDLRPL